MRKCKKIAKKINAKKKRVNIRSHNLWNLAAERLRWMGFDNRLVIDCFTNVATYMVIFLQMIDSEVKILNLLHYIQVHFQKWISWVFGFPRTSCTTSGWPVRPSARKIWITYTGIHAFWIIRGVIKPTRWCQEVLCPDLSRPICPCFS